MSMMPNRKSGGGCSAIGCSMRRNTNLLSKVKMFRFPKDADRRAAWCNAMKRDKWTPNNNSLICNAHFVTGMPSSDPQHPDYVPSIFNFKQTCVEEGKKKLMRYERNVKRVKSDSLNTDSDTDNVSTHDHNVSLENSQQVSMNSMTKDIAVQTDFTLEDFDAFERQIESLHQENFNLRKEATMTRTFSSVTKSPSQLKFYTGVENIAVFNSLLAFLLAVWQPEVKVALQPCEQFLLVLMKLRLGLLNQDLACRFQIGVGTVSTVFHSWLNIMFVNLRRLIYWPSKKEILKNMPQCFRDVSLENVKCIIDCSEIFIEKPNNFTARAQTYSNYKHHNTIKFLVGITPSGVICFISKAWGGRVTDKHLTKKSGFLDLLEKDDVVLADRGFKIEDLLSEKNAKLHIPASTKNKSQLSADEVHHSRKMSKVRVHIERAIRKIKTFKILESNLPISVIKTKDDGDFSAIDKILCVICALCNLSNPIIKS